MKQPKQRGTRISPARIAEWLEVFRFYRHLPNELAIQQWLNRFSKADRDVAARVLDCVTVVSAREALMGYRHALQQLEGWNVEPALRRGRWFFVGFGGAGESGQAMVRSFREANQLTFSVYNDLFCGATDLPLKKLTMEDHVVFIDDFSGSGRQVSTAWPTLQELIASDATCHLILTSATRTAMSKIEALINLALTVYIVLEEYDNVFSSECRKFTVREKSTIEKYGRRANRRNPKGFGG